MNDKDLSLLLLEAKELYFERKKRNRAILSAVTLSCFLAAFGIGIFQNMPLEQTYLYDPWAQEIYQAQNGSFIEDMGLPVDEYGLLMVL